MAGPFSGISNQALILAGGANFPSAAPWEGGEKTWQDTIWVLPEMGRTWVSGGRLPRPLAYGVSIEWDGGVLCIGGNDAVQHHAGCFLLRWNGETMDSEQWPELPFPLAEMAGVRIGTQVHVLGGTTRPGAKSAERHHWVLDLEDPDKGWYERESIPGLGRIFPVVGVVNKTLYVFSGAALIEKEDGAVTRSYLADAWQFREGRGWLPMSSLPWPVVAAPSPAVSSGGSHLLVFGGDNGQQAGRADPSQHTGFSRTILAYHTLTDTWREWGLIPGTIAPPVTLPTVEWRHRVIFPSGEVRPGVRTSRVAVFEQDAQRRVLGWFNTLVICVYLGAMLLVGWWFLKRKASSSTEAYFRGGQRVPWWVAGLSIFATMLSSLTFMGIPARAYATDMTWYIGQLPILLIAPLVAFAYLPFFRRLNLTSAYEYLEHRFNAACRLFAAFSFLLLHIGRIAIVLYLPSLALTSVSNIPLLPAIVIIGILCVIYTVLGGIEAVVWTDAIQAVVLLGGALLCLGIAVGRLDGGVVQFLEIVRVDNKAWQNMEWTSLDWRTGTLAAPVLFLAFFFNSFVPYTSGQDVVQRYMTTRDERAARRSIWVNLVLSLLGSAIFFLLGAAIYAFYKTHPETLDPGLDSADSILPSFVLNQLPIGISGLLIAAIFAASQSTISSSLNSISAAWIRDIDARWLRPGRSDAVYLAGAKWAVLLAGLFGIGCAIAMALSQIESAFQTFNTLIGLTSGSLAGLFALGVFTRRAHGSGALIGALLGFGLVLTLYFSDAPVSGLLYACIGCVTCILVGWLTSLWLPGEARSGLSLGD